MMRKSVLVIDDEKDFCFFLKKNLEATGAFSVMVAAHPDTGIRMARRRIPDVILLDICMPVRDGFSVLEALKKDLKTVSIPVIMLTAMEDEAYRKRASWLYNDGYLVKPVSYAKLFDEIERVLEGASDV
jgi:DNA-binding response OmpR family regulator